MRKRPLGLAAVILTIVFLVLPADLWMNFQSLPEGRGSPDFLSGTVCEIAPGGKAVSLKHTNISDTGIILVYFDAEIPFSIGNTIQIDKNFKLATPETPTNPGQFDARLYYQTQKIIFLCFAEKAAVTDKSVKVIPQFFYELRRDLGIRLQILFPESCRGVIGAMLLGDKSELKDETKELYQKSGMSHLLAISGLHVSVFGMTLYRLLRRCGMSLWMAGIPSMLTVLSYGILTGMGISTARAVLMFLLSAVADMSGKSYDMLTALAAAAICLLVNQPLYARNASFLLSFGAVLGIGSVYPVLQELFAVRNRVVQTLLLSLSVQLMTLPLTQYFYCEISLYSVLLNLVVVPLMTILMFSGILALGLSFLSFDAAGIPAFCCIVIIQLYEKLGTVFLCLPASVLHCGKPEIWQIVLYYMCLFGFLSWRFYVQECRKKQIAQAAVLGEEEMEEEEKRKEPKLRQKQICSAAGLFFLNLLLLLRLTGGFQFTMLDVGQGEALFLRTKAGTSILVDGGSTSISEAGIYRIIPFLKTQGIAKLDYVIVTHVDKDHISGIQELLECSMRPGNVKITTLLLSYASLAEEAGQELAALAEACGTKVEKIMAGMILKDSSAQLECIYPGKEEDYEDTNAASVTMRFTYKKFSILMTGDLGVEGEKKILNSGETGNSLNCEILKAGHHGSKTSSSEEWLSAVSPVCTLISCGKENPYGHPHQETLERLEKAGSSIMTTADCGAITVRSDGQEFRVEVFCPERLP